MEFIACRLPPIDTNPECGAFVGIFERDGGTHEARERAMEALAAKCRLIIQRLTEISFDGGASLRRCCRIDFGLNGTHPDVKWGITGVTWGHGMDLYANIDVVNSVVFIDTVVDGLLADWLA